MKKEMRYDKEELKKEIETFVNSFKSVVLGTVSENQEIDVTYAPYLNYEGENYIYISEIGDHYSNLKNNKQKFEVMFLQDESQSVSVLARKRVRYNVTAEFLERNENFENILDIFEEKIGREMKIVRNMKDFHLVKLNILDGRYVKGFGQAYILKDGEIFQMTGDKKKN